MSDTSYKKPRIPPAVNVLVLALAATGFYTWVGQKVPQKEVPAPVVIEISKSATPADMAALGKEIAEGKGLCLTCHTIDGRSGALRYPDLQGIYTLAADRREGYSAFEYLNESLYEPDVFIVDGYTKGMPAISKPPVALTDDEILAVLAWLEAQGGTPTVTPDLKHKYNGG
jgi:mono/diheme cytochrome c family protein